MEDHLRDVDDPDGHRKRRQERQQAAERVGSVFVTMRQAPKRRTATFSTKEALLAKLIPRCAKEYEATFGKPWDGLVLGLYKATLVRSRIETDAWRVMLRLGRAAADAVNFFESRGLDPLRHDHGIFYARELHSLLKRHRGMLERLLSGVTEKYQRPLDERRYLVETVNIPGSFGKLPFGRELTGRELAIVSILLEEGAHVSFDRGMTVGDAIDQELRRMAIATRRVRSSRSRPRLRSSRLLKDVGERER